MAEASSLNGTYPISCWAKIIESKWTDAALITSCVALLIIGIVASTGVFSAIGTTNAAYLSYGMYGGAALLLVIEIAKLVRNSCFKDNHLDGPRNRDILQRRGPNAATRFRGPVPHDYVSPSIKRSEPLSPEAIQNLKEQAASYASANAEEFPGVSSQEVAQHMLTYILNVIDNPEFQKDPVAYMEAWASARWGQGEVFKVPEDHARSFLKRALRS